VSVFVDPRVGSGDLIPTLRALGCPAESQPLDFADCMFVGNGKDGPVAVGIELKQLKDILQCVSTGRFSGHQLPGLVQTYNEVYLVVEGHYRPNPQDGVLEERWGRDWKAVTLGNRQWMYRDFENFLTTVEVRGGVRLRRVRDRQETARVVAGLYKWWSDEFQNHTSHIAINRSRDTALLVKPSLRFQVACVLPGLGLMRAGQAAGKFPSTLAMMAASAQDWIMPGIGKKTAEGIIKAIESD
jgi:ERCC4-type nuclease